MSKHRLYHAETLKPNSVLELDGAQAHYLLNVLRLKPDSSVVLFDGSGLEYLCTVQRATKKTLLLRIGAGLDSGTESPLNTCLVQSVVKGERMDYCVQKATELGVNTIIPIITHRTIVRLDAKRRASRREHWQKIAISASEQSGRLVPPTVKTPRTFDYLITHDFAGNVLGRGTRLLMHTRPPHVLLDDIEHEIDEPLSLFVGPEGGFTNDEVSRLVEHGAQSLKMGQRILRSETAGLIGLSACQLCWGDL